MSKKGRGIKWTQEDDQFVLDNFKKLSNREIGRILNRGQYAIAQRANILGLRNPKTVIINVGDKFNKLTAIEFIEKRKSYSYWKFKCECGKESITRASDVAASRILSCGCLANERYKELYGLEPGAALTNELFTTYKRNASYRQLTFELTFDEFKNLINQNCFMCGIEPQQYGRINRRPNAGDFRYNGIDRYDNSKGYILENCKPCCGTCNTAKLSMDLKTFETWYKRMGEYYVSKIKS